MKRSLASALFAGAVVLSSATARAESPAERAMARARALGWGAEGNAQPRSVELQLGSYFYF